MTGANAEQFVRDTEAGMSAVAAVVKGNSADAPQRVAKMAERVKELEKKWRI